MQIGIGNLERLVLVENGSRFGRVGNTIDVVEIISTISRIATKLIFDISIKVVLPLSLGILLITIGEAHCSIRF